MSAFYHVDLTLEDALTFWSANHELLSCEPAFLNAMLLQHYREREPRIIITWNGKVDIPFTVPKRASWRRPSLASSARARIKNPK